jgi:DNA polymerase-3 subunit delta'
MTLSENWGLLGHEWAVELLREHIAGGRMRHAYLFTGPQGAGRRTLALRFAQALNCANPPEPGQPCGTCRACTHIAEMQHPDLHVIQAEKEGGTLKVDQVRELQSRLSLHPYEARYRIALLLRFEEARGGNSAAMNALLKTLEEPNPQVILLLTAESAERLLPTIVSRCEVLRLRSVPLERLESGLQAGWGLDAENARLLAHVSGGRPGYALRLSQEPQLLEQRRGWLEDLELLLPASRVERFAWAEAAAKDKDTLRAVLIAWLSLWRDALLKSSGAAASISNLDCEAFVQRLARQIDLQGAHRAACAVEATLNRLDGNVNARLAAEVLMLDLPKV